MEQLSSQRQDSDSFYVNDCRQSQSNTHAIQTLTGQISRLIGTLSTEEDFQRCRSMVDDAVRQATETRALVARIQEHRQQAQNPSERNNRRMMHHKLSDNLAITARVLEDVVRRFNTEEKKRFAAEEAPGPRSESDVLGFVGEDAPLVTANEERSQRLQRGEEDARCLQRIYTDLANTADERASFEALEHHMASATADIECGREATSMGKYDQNIDTPIGSFRRAELVRGGFAVFAVLVTLYIIS